jgi:hypothetical protein
VLGKAGQRGTKNFARAGLLAAAPSPLLLLLRKPARGGARPVAH